MTELSDQAPDAPSFPPARPRRWNRYARWSAVAVLLAAFFITYLAKDHICTLSSLRRVPGTNAYVIDYYVAYNLNEIRAHGMDVKNVEDGLIDVFFPDVIASIGKRVKGYYLDNSVATIPPNVDRCSTIVSRLPGGHVFFGRNFDWMHDACLIVRMHDESGLTSIAVIDLHYLNLDRNDLDETNLIQRIPLLFAPYYLQDGMNRHGVAVADMSVDGVTAPFDAGKPDILHATAMRLVLDDAKNIDEAIDIFKRYNVHFGATTCHFMVADATGKSAVVEFIDGKVAVTHSKVNWQVCTNHQIYGTSEEDCDKTCDRYRHASGELTKLSANAGMEDVTRIMRSISKKDWTMWSSAYDLSGRRLRFAYRGYFDKPYDDSLVNSK
jgi:hypothetical protein